MEREGRGPSHGARRVCRVERIPNGGRGRRRGTGPGVPPKRPRAGRHAVRRRSQCRAPGIPYRMAGSAGGTASPQQGQGAQGSRRAAHGQCRPSPAQPHNHSTARTLANGRLIPEIWCCGGQRGGVAAAALGGGVGGVAPELDRVREPAHQAPLQAGETGVVGPPRRHRSSRRHRKQPGRFKLSLIWAGPEPMRHLGAIAEYGR